MAIHPRPLSEQTPPPSRAALLVRRMVLLTGGLLVAGLLAEGLARTLRRDATTLFPRFHAAARYGEYTLRCLRPHTTFWHRSVDGRWKFTTNARGFRATRDYDYAKSNGALRVLCLGDSHTQGFECRQDRTYAAVIERYLAHRGIRAEVINAGVSGFSTAEALAFLENEGLRYAPDAVVLGFFANDLDDNVKADLFRLQDGLLITNKQEHIPGVRPTRLINEIAPLRWLSQNSYAYSAVFNAIWERRKQALLNSRERELSTELAVKERDSDVELARHKEALCAALVRRMHASCVRGGARFYLLDVPQLTAEGCAFRSSIPAALETPFRASADAVISSTNVLAEVHGATELFVPHGQRHISETTHLLLGVACAREIAAHADSAR